MDKKQNSLENTQSMSTGYAVGEVIKRAVKYLIQGLAVGLACHLIPRGRGINLDFESIIMISLTAASVFAILDIYIPSAGSAARTGIGLAAGFNLAGFPAATSIFGL